MAKLIFRYGSMNSGKSTILIQINHNYKEQGMKTLVVKPEIDTKGNNKIVSRIGAEIDVDFLMNEKFNITDFIKLLKEEKPEAILVDEAQFLTPSQVEDLYYITKKLGIAVLCFGLRVDFMSNSFPGSSRLLALADELIEIPTICKCGTKARLVGRKVNGEYVFEGDQVVIDGSDDVEYVPLCGNCYIDAKESKKLVLK